MEGFSTIGGSSLRFFTGDGGCRNWLRIKFKMHGSSCCMAAIEFTDSIRWKSKWIKYLKNHSFSLTCIAGKYSLIGIDWWRINEENQSQNDCQKEKNNGPSSRHFLAESNSTCIRFWSLLWRLCWPSVAREKVKAKMRAEQVSKLPFLLNGHLENSYSYAHITEPKMSNWFLSPLWTQSSRRAYQLSRHHCELRTWMIFSFFCKNPADPSW